MAKRELKLKVNTDVSELTDGIEKVTKAIERLRKSLEQLNSTGLNIEIEQQPEITVGVDLSSQKDISIEAKLPKRYPVKDKYNRKVIAVFNSENAAREYVASCKWYYMDEVD